jgi:hypothetical protein
MKIQIRYEILFLIYFYFWSYSTVSDIAW